MFYDSCTGVDLPPTAVEDPAGSPNHRTVDGIAVPSWRALLWWSLLFFWVLVCFLLDLGIDLGTLGAGLVGLSAQLIGRYRARKKP